MKQKGDSFYIYGKKPVEEQLMRNPENVLRVFVSDSMKKNDGGLQELRAYVKDQKIPLNAISRNKIKEYVGDVTDQGVIALINRPEYEEFDEWFEAVNIDTNPAVVILDHVEDVHNFGAILRTAAAVGVAGVIVAKDHQAPVNGVTYKTSAGAVTRIPVIRVSNINQVIKKLKDQKFWIAAVDMDESKKSSIWNQTYDTPMGFIFGGEGKGVSEKTREHADFIVSIPMENSVESLNVSVAAAVVLYDWKRQYQGQKTEK